MVFLFSTTGVCLGCAKWHIFKRIGMNNNSLYNVQLREIFKMTERAENVFSGEQYSVGHVSWGT